MKMLANRRGEEFVEAAIVLPLLILTMLSMIMAAVFLFSYHVKQSEAHISLMRDVCRSKSVFAVKRKSASSSGTIKGTYRKGMSRSGSFRAYAIRQSDAILAGELAG